MSPPDAPPLVANRAALSATASGDILASCGTHPNEWINNRTTACVRYPNVRGDIRDVETRDLVGQVFLDIVDYIYTSDGLLWAETLTISPVSYWDVGALATYDVDLACDIDCSVESADQIYPTPVTALAAGTWYLRSSITSIGQVGFGWTVPTVTIAIAATGVLPAVLPLYGSPVVRCDKINFPSAVAGCVFPSYAPTARWSTTGQFSEVAEHIKYAEGIGLPGRPGTQPLTRLTNPLLGDLNRNVACQGVNRYAACPSSFPRTPKKSCDEYPFASTQQGAFTGGGTFSACPVDAAQNSAHGGDLSFFYRSERVIGGDAFWVDIDGQSGFDGPTPGGGGASSSTPSTAAPALVRDNSDDTMKIWRWLSNGNSFSRANDYQSGSFSLSNVGDRVASGDVDGDGHDDIVMAYQLPDGTFSFYVFKNGGVGAAEVWYTSGPFSLTPVAGRLVVADFNGDGKAEPELVRDNGDGTMKIWRWSSTGSSFSRTSDYQSGSFPLSRVEDRVATGDVDGDGDADIVMAYQHPEGTFSFYVFKHGGVGAAEVWYTSGTFSLVPVAGRLVVADFTGDSKGEPALVRDNGDGTMKIWRWSSTGTSFSRATDYESGAFSLSNVGDRVASGDVDGDGDADIVMAYQQPDGTFSFYVFKDGGVGAAQIWYTSGTFSLSPVAGRLVLGKW